MSKKRKYSQINNFNTFCMYKREFSTLAENVFVYKNLPITIDVSYMNKCLFKKGEVAVYYEEAVDGLVALPFINIGPLDIYNKPIKIQCIAKNGVKSRILNPGEYVIIYDNDGKYPLWLDLEQYGERLAQIRRIMDINIGQQKTPRIIQTPQELKRTMEDVTSDIDACVDTVIAYDNLNVDNIDVILTPAPYIANDLRVEFDRLWSEALNLIGITNLSMQKKERMIRDEMIASQGGCIANRFNRYRPRKEAIKRINYLFSDFLLAPIEVEFYDKEPDSEVDDIPDTNELNDFEEVGDSNVL